jgi:two-component system chemotaxis response regulator CheB
MAINRIVVIGASSGGIDALRTIAGDLPADFPAPICIGLHLGPESPGVVPEILTRAGKLTAVHPRDKETLAPGRIYVAPPDRHLLVEPGRLRVTRGPKENRFRPAIDPLFRSAAQVFGPAAIGVVLTGNLDDGVSGLWTIKQLGGIAVVQDQHDARYPSMPAQAARHVAVDYSVPLYQIGGLLTQLSATSTGDRAPAASGTLGLEVSIAKNEPPSEPTEAMIGPPSQYTCGECNGVLMGYEEGGRRRFRCHTGHAYSRESLLTSIDENIQSALDNALRSLEEGQMLIDEMLAAARQAEERGGMEVRLDRAKTHTATIRRLIHDWEGIGGADR